MAALNDAWMENCLIAISKVGGSDVQFAGMTETVELDLGEKGIEGIPLVNGGRVTKWNAEGDSTITMDVYPLEVGNGKGFFDMIHGAATQDTTQPLRVYNSHYRDKYRILVLWTDDTSVSTAQATTSSGKAALRIGLAECYFTQVKPSFTDGILKWSVTAKCTPYDKNAGSNIMAESTDGSSSNVLPAIAAYTTSYKFA